MTDDPKKPDTVEEAPDDDEPETVTEPIEAPAPAPEDDASTSPEEG
jgi:hypothetical protein